MKKRKQWNRLIAAFVTSIRPRLDRKTVAWYEARLRTWHDFIADRAKPKRVTVADLDEFFGQLRAKGLKFNTRKGQLTATKAFFKWLLKRGHIKKNPFDEFEPLRKERDVTAEPIPLSYAYRMIRAAEASGSPYGIRDAAIMRLLLTTGARRSEITNLEMQHLNLDIGSVLYIGKFGHRRVVPLKPTTIWALRRWLEIRPGDATAVFVSLYPNKAGIYFQLRPDALNDIMVKWRDAAKLPKVSCSPHMWRRRFASELKKSGDPFSLQLLLGHSDISTTQRYVSSSPEELAELLRRFGPDISV